MRIRLRIALRYLVERKTRTVLTTLSVVVGVMLIFGLNGLVPALEDSLRGTTAGADQADLTVTSEARGPFNQSLIEEVDDLPIVAFVTGSLIRPVALPLSMAPANPVRLILSLPWPAVGARRSQPRRLVRARRRLGSYRGYVPRDPVASDPSRAVRPFR